VEEEEGLPAIVAGTMGSWGLPANLPNTRKLRCKFCQYFTISAHELVSATFGTLKKYS